MKKLLFLLFLLYGFINPINSQHICGNTNIEETEDTGNKALPFCGDNPNQTTDFGNFMYIPTEDTEVLTMKVNVHVMQKEIGDPKNYTTDDIPFLTDLINNRLNNIASDETLIEECMGVTGTIQSVDLKVKFQLGEIFFHVDPIAHVNGEGYPRFDEFGNESTSIVTNGLTSYYCKVHYLDGTNEADDALNIFFVEPPNAGGHGWGPGYTSENRNHVIMANRWSSDGTDWWEFDGTILHEIGHCLGLHHSWLSSQENLFEYDCNIGSGWNLNNHLMAYNAPQNFNSPLQDAHMRRMLLTSWREKQLINPPLNNETYVFDYDYTLPLGSEINWIGDIVVASGNTLTIEGTLQMHLDKKIIVERGAELNVNGGRITSCDQWEGIRIEGDGLSGSQANAGLVVLRQDAIIENARKAISTNPKHIPWPLRQEFYGGLIQADNATFINCRRAVEFMKYGTGFIEDQSYFSKCTFESIATSAVTIWSNNNVTFTNCFFNDISEKGIYSYDSEVIVKDGCEFTNLKTGIDFLGTYPHPFGSQVGEEGTQPNNFQSTDFGIHSIAQGNAETMIITNNNFLGGSYGVHLNGMSSFEINGNDFSGEYAAIEPVSTGGTHKNYVMNNNISSSTYGSHAVSNNYNLEYLDNCFGYNTNSDVYVNSGSIFIEQGNELIANGNCFSKNGIPEIDNTLNDEIKLWVWEDEPTTSCEYPTLVDNDASYNVVVDVKSTSKLPDNCGSSYSPGIMNVRTFCRGPFKTKKDLTDKIAEVENTIKDIENDASLSPSYKAYLLKFYKRCLDKLKIKVIIVILEPEPNDPDLVPKSQRFEAAILYAAQLSDFNLQILAYGLMVNTNQYIRAGSFLDVMVATNLEQSNFIVAQRILLDYLSDTDNYQIKNDDRNTLEAIGLGLNPLDGYARAIYELIEGERIELSIPDPHNSIRPRNNIEKINVPKYSIYPNPSTQGSINLTIDGLEEIDLFLNVTDIYGRVLENSKIQSRQSKVSSLGWSNGIYIVQLSDNNRNIVYSQKVIVTQ